MTQKNIKTSTALICLIATIGFISNNLNAQKVTKLFEKGQYEKAEQYCVKQSDEKQSACYTELAEAYLKIKNYDKAAEFYAKTEKSKGGYEKIGDAYFYQNDYEKAAEYYEKAFVDENEKLKESYSKIADAYLEINKIEPAESYYKKADNKEGFKKIGDFFLTHKNNKNRTWAHINYERAIKYYEKAFSGNNEKLKESYNKIADSLVSIEYYESASKYYKKTKNRKGWEKIANGYFEKKEYRLAAVYYKKAFYNQKEKLEESMIKIAEAYFSIKKYDKAAEYYKIAFYNQKDKLDESLKKIADTYFSIKKYEKAADYYEKANLKKDVQKCWSLLRLNDRRDSKSYNIVKIGKQVWMAENLAYKAGYGCWAYDNKPSKVKIFGYLYDLKTAEKVCPDGWHLPDYNEWTTLVDHLGGEEIAGGKMKSKSDFWKENIGATNSSGFSALPAGSGPGFDGKFSSLYYYANFWSSTMDDSEGEPGSTSVYYRGICLNNYNKRVSECYFASETGKSVRCIRD